MFSSLSVDRFRGFDHLRVDPLDRFNLFIGRNNVGKTALLESIFLLVGPTNPELPLRLSVLRGIDQFKTDPEELWGWLFHRKNFDETVYLKAEMEKGRSRQLTLSLKERKEIRFRDRTKRGVDSNQSTISTSTNEEYSDLIIDYIDSYGEKYKSRAFIKENSIGYEKVKFPQKNLRVPTSVFVTSRGGNAAENAERFSKLEEVGREKELLLPMRILEPRLERLAVLVTATGPTIHGDIGIGRMVPIPFMGEGTGRLLTLLLAISISKSGVVMVDEIESGLHYSAMSKIWTAVAKAARESDVQIFATTHSFECLRAAHDSFSESSFYDFQLHRLERINDHVEAFHYDREMVSMAIISGMEIR